MDGPVGHTILLGDDDNDTCVIFSLALQHAGYTVLVAKDGSEGIRLARQHFPAVILMDLMMPLMDGATALQILRSDYATRGLTIIALTGRATLHDAQTILDSGFDELVLKPIMPLALVDVVEQSIRARALEA